MKSAKSVRFVWELKKVKGKNLRNLRNLRDLKHQDYAKKSVCICELKIGDRRESQICGTRSTSRKRRRFLPKKVPESNAPGIVSLPNP